MKRSSCAEWLAGYLVREYASFGRTKTLQQLGEYRLEYFQPPSEEHYRTDNVPMVTRDGRGRCAPYRSPVIIFVVLNVVPTRIRVLSAS